MQGLRGQRRRRTAAVAAGVVVALVLALTWVLISRPGPEDAAREYLEAIAQGEIVRADVLVPPPAIEGGGGMPPAVIQGWTPFTLTDVAVQPRSGERGQRSVHFTADVSGEDASGELTVRRSDGEWQVQGSLAQVVDVGLPIGPEHPVGDLVPGGRTQQLLLYPGEAMIDLPGGRYVDLPGQRILVTRPSSEPIVLPLEPAMTAELEQELLDAAVAQTCPGTTPPGDVLDQAKITDVQAEMGPDGAQFTVTIRARAAVPGSPTPVAVVLTQTVIAPMVDSYKIAEVRCAVAGA